MFLLRKSYYNCVYAEETGAARGILIIFYTRQILIILCEAHNLWIVC